MYPELDRAAAKLAQFSGMMGELAQQAQTMPLPDFYEELIARTGYAVMLESKNTVEDRTRLEKRAGAAHLHQRLSGECGGGALLAGFLDEIALYTDLDSHDPDQDCVVMMTMHSAKGLEFPYVFLCSLCEGVFPSTKTKTMPAMEEERRLAFVALTRAEKGLYLSEADGRNFDGTPRYPSRLSSGHRPQSPGLHPAAGGGLDPGGPGLYRPQPDLSAGDRREHGILRGAAGEAYSVRLRYGAGCGHGQGCSCGTVR